MTCHVHIEEGNHSGYQTVGTLSIYGMHEPQKPNFDVLLTVRLSIVLVTDQLNAQILVL